MSQFIQLAQHDLGFQCVLVGLVVLVLLVISWIQFWYDGLEGRYTLREVLDVVSMEFVTIFTIAGVIGFIWVCAQHI